MPQLTYRIENAPGRIYGKNANELVFKEPSSGVVVYSTTTTSGLLKNRKKQLFRGPANEKEGGVCVATIYEPGSGTLEMHHHLQPRQTRAEDDDKATTSATLKLKKTTSWVPFTSRDNHTVTFRDAQYTWRGTSQLKRETDGHIVANVAGPWFWQGKLGDMEVDISSEGQYDDTDEGREVLEMVLATFVLRWWGERAKAEEMKREKKHQKEEAETERKQEKEAVASQKRELEEKKKIERGDEEDNKEGREKEVVAGLAKI